MRKHRMERLFELVILAMGMTGTIGCFLNAFQLSLSVPVLIIILVLLAVYMLIGFQSVHKKRYVMIGIGIYILVLLLFFSQIKTGLLHMMNQILSTYENNSQFSFRRFPLDVPNIEAKTPLLITLSMIFVPVEAMIYRALYHKHSYFSAFFVSMPFLFAILLFTLRPEPRYFIMTLTFYLILFGMSFAGKHATHASSDAILKCGVCFGMIALCVMITMQQLFPESTYRRDQRIEDFRLDIQLKVRELIEGRELGEQGSLDLSTARDRYYIGANDLRVWMQQPQDVYLHAYSASVYTDHSWTQPTDDQFQQFYNWREKTLVPPFQFSRALMANKAGYDRPTKIDVEVLQANPAYVYMPYDIDSNINRTALVQDSYVKADETTEEYSFEFWGDAQIARQPESSSVTVYRRQVEALNLIVPEHLTRTLKQLQIPGLRDDASEQEKIKLIQEYITAFGTYTLHPGATPKDKDFIQYFLEENKQGYCVHYASAAVMLLRSHGVPARFASGYRVYRNSFKSGVADVKDYQAHAWVEILDPRRSWIPLEVTPSASTSDPTASNQNNNQTQTTPQEEEETPNTEPNQNDQPTQDTQNKQDTDRSSEFVIPWQAAGILAVPLGAFAILWLRRNWTVSKRKRQMQQPDQRMAILACGRYLGLLSLQEEHIDPEIRHILEEAQFSTHPVNEKQRDALLTYCKAQANQHELAQKRTKRLVNKWIKCLY